MKLPILFSVITFVLATATANAQSSVWKVSKGDQKLYIGGTCHILRAQDYPLPAEFDLAYAQADKLFFEIDPAVAKDPAFAMQVMQNALYLDGRSLQTVLNQEAYAALSEAVATSGMPMDGINRMKPGLAVMVVAVQELMKIGVSQEGVDFYYANRARQDGKTIGSLETAEFQMNMIINMGQGYESDFVLMSLKDLDKMETFIAEMIEAWRTGNIDQLDTLFNSTLLEYPALYEDILVSRNEDWMPQIEAMLTTPEIEYVLFGAAHAAGEDGVLAMLKKKGYTVEQLVAE